MSTMIKTGCCCWRDRHRDRWNKREKPETDPYNTQLMFDQGVKAVQRGKDSFSKNDAGAIGHP